MRIDIRNILGIERAEINLPPGGIVEVIGPNASGKSSVAVAAQAVLTQEINPLGAPAPQSKRVYLHDGAEDCEANLVDNGEVVTWRPDRGVNDGAPRYLLQHPRGRGPRGLHGAGRGEGASCQAASPRSCRRRSSSLMPSARPSSPTWTPRT